MAGGDTSSLLSEVKKQGLDDRVRFTGPLYGEALRKHLVRADLMVYPGGIGLSLVQAFSYGIPVITTDLINLHGPEIELLEQDSNGNFYKHDSVADLASKILYWRQKLERSRENISMACVNSIREKGYLPEIVAGNALQFLREKL